MQSTFQGMLANPDIVPSTSINCWILSILMFLLHFSSYYTFTPLLLNLFHHYLITLLQGHMAKHTVAL